MWIGGLGGGMKQGLKEGIQGGPGGVQHILGVFAIFQFPTKF